VRTARHARDEVDVLARDRLEVDALRLGLAVGQGQG